MKSQQYETGNVCTARLPQSFWKELHQTLWMWVFYIFIGIGINIYCTEMYVQCTEMYIYYTYSTYILYRSVCLSVVKSDPIQEEVVKHWTPRKYTVLNRNSVFSLCKIFQEHNPGIKELPVHGYTEKNLWYRLLYIHTFWGKSRFTELH